MSMSAVKRRHCHVGSLLMEVTIIIVHSNCAVWHLDIYNGCLPKLLLDCDSNIHADLFYHLAQNGKERKKRKAMRWISWGSRTFTKSLWLWHWLEEVMTFTIQCQIETIKNIKYLFFRILMN